MTESFELPVTYGGKDLLLKAELQAWGYSHRIRVEINGRFYTFEPDEEQNYRAMAENHQHLEDRDLLQEIIKTLELAFR